MVRPSGETSGFPMGRLSIPENFLQEVTRLVYGPMGHSRLIKTGELIEGQLSLERRPSTRDHHRSEGGSDILIGTRFDQLSFRRRHARPMALRQQLPYFTPYCSRNVTTLARCAFLYAPCRLMPSSTWARMRGPPVYFVERPLKNDSTSARCISSLYPAAT
jgi:hypothetical protein